MTVGKVLMSVDPHEWKPENWRIGGRERRNRDVERLALSPRLQAFTMD